MQKNIKHFFAGGNTAHGFVHFFDHLLVDLERIFILKGGPGTGKSTLMRNLGKKAVSKGKEAWFLHSPLDHETLDGIIIPDWNAAIVNGGLPYRLDAKTPGVVEDYVNLGEAWDGPALLGQKARIQKLQAKINKAHENAYAGFAKANQIHDKWESIYIKNMNFSEADALANELITLFFADKRTDRTAKVSHRFLGAATAVGAVDFVLNLTEDVPRRYFVKGRAGSGKSHMLKKISRTAQERGFDVEKYHCGFDPNSLDMLVFRELGIAIFDSTEPHEHFPSREGDTVIDMYERCVTPGTDEKYADRIFSLRTEYKKEMKAAIAQLAEAKRQHDELKDIYVSAVDFSIVNRKKYWIEEQLEALTAQS